MKTVYAMIVDDEPEICLTIQRFLNRHSVQCVLAGNGNEALELRKEHPIDMIITDFRMPELDGLSFLKKTRQENRDIPVIVMTNPGDQHMILDALHEGANNFLQKPVTLKMLQNVLLPLVQMIQDKKGRQFDYNCLASILCELTLDNRVEKIPGTVNYLLQHLRSDMYHTRIHSLEVSLYEMLANAVIHGNLGISSAQRIEMEASGQYHQFFDERRAATPYSDRYVHLKMEVNQAQARFTITDQGEGFNWRAAKEDFAELTMFEETGRGIMMTKVFCDEVLYNEKGNQVTLVINAAALPA